MKNKKCNQQKRGKMQGQEEIKRLLSLAIKNGILSWLGISEQIANVRQLMAEFSVYKGAVNATLERVLDIATEERAIFLTVIAAVKAGNAAAVDEAMAELATKKQQVVDAVTGIISTAESPVIPTPVPPIVDGELPPVTIPTIPVEPPVTGLDPIVPVTIEPSPPGVGVDGGFNISE